ncbi:hypothetical protein RUM44_010659 [Polyplax serrata]|uniref:CUB domain-containing protein n=1 Tax=Polyplax serrata TaxID=468196 RepID=A0ABR1APL0_POLSC
MEDTSSSPVIVDGNQRTDVSNRKEPGLFCGEIEQPQTFISETSFVKLVFYTDNFTDQTYFSFDTRAEQPYEVYLRYGQHPELYPNRRGKVDSSGGGYCERSFEDCKLQTCYVQSPAYPGIYPRNLHCKYHLNTRLPFIKLYIENEEFNIDGQRCENIMTCPMRSISSGSQHCPYDYIRIFDGTNETSPVIGTFCGMGKFPYSIIGTGRDLYVEFVSSPAGPLLNTGFHFNVGNWPGHVETAGYKNGTCNWILTSEALSLSRDSEGIFLSVAHWYPPHTSCTYLMLGQKNQIVRLYFPRINRIESPISPIEGDCGESLTLYDASWPDDSKIIKTFCDTFSRAMEKHDFVSTGNALFVRFESKTGSYSGSSLYYWAHYDFFNNTSSGERVPNTACDEVFPSWKYPKGTLRSPYNTLVYKKQGSANQDITCLYRFITDKRLYARIVLTIESINFKDHPYNTPCTECWEERLDKLLIWEPQNDTSVFNTPGATCLCKNNSAYSPSGIKTIISKGENVNLQLIVEGTHAAGSYFKHSMPLFEARYEFVHGPLCGPSILAPATDGELHFPHYEALGFVEPPRYLRCLWEIRVNENRDIWLHFDKFMFTSRNCDDGKLRVYLPSKVEPILTVCGENVSALKDMPILTSMQLSQGLSEIDQRAVFIEFEGSGTPARAAFKIAWTELFHVDRHSTGLLTSRLTKLEDGGDDGCEFPCPGDSGLCIPLRLICNGVANCPNITGGPSGDELPELCTATETEKDNWLAVGLGAAGAIGLAVICFVLLCRSCCNKRSADDIHVPY